MNEKKSMHQNTFIQVSDSFWPIFFARKIQIQLIGQATCYALTDVQKKLQIVVVYPEHGCSNFPTPYAIVKKFPMIDLGEIINPSALPLHELRNSTGVFIDDYAESAIIKDRRLIVLQVTWEEEESLREQGREIVITNSVLYGFEAPAEEAGKIAITSENHRLIYQEVVQEKIRIIVLLRQKTQVKLSDNVLISEMEDGELFVDIKDKKNKSTPALSEYN